jgi:hypothetical protein
MSENTNNQANISYYISKYFKIIVLLLLIIVITIPLIEMIYLLGIRGLFNHFADKIINTTGINQYLAKAIIILLMIPLLWSFKWTISLSSQKRRTGYTIVAGYICIFYFTMFFMTKEQKFDFTTGEAIKYYAVTPEGIRYFDAPGYDPKYGIPLKPVDQGVARSETFNRLPPKKLDEPQQFFDYATKEPLVWYYEAPDGTLEFFDQPGFHPKYGQELKPITPEIVSKYDNRVKTTKHMGPPKIEGPQNKIKSQSEDQQQQVGEYRNFDNLNELSNKKDNQKHPEKQIAANYNVSKYSFNQIQNIVENLDAKVTNTLSASNASSLESEIKAVIDNLNLLRRSEPSKIKEIDDLESKLNYDLYKISNVQRGLLPTR